MTEDKVDFDGMFYEDIAAFFGEVDTIEELMRIMLEYVGENWVVPHVAGKRMAYLRMMEQGTELTWDQVAKL